MWLSRKKVSTEMMNKLADILAFAFGTIFIFFFGFMLFAAIILYRLDIWEVVVYMLMLLFILWRVGRSCA
jgi:hypothetical protein